MCLHLFGTYSCYSHHYSLHSGIHLNNCNHQDPFSIGQTELSLSTCPSCYLIEPQEASESLKCNLNEVFEQVQKEAHAWGNTLSSCHSQ